MAIAVSNLLQNGTASPGAASQATASASCVSGRVYLVTFLVIKGSSTTPTVSGVTGWSQTWTQIGTFNFPNTGATRRVGYTFYCVANTSTSGALTVSGLNTPDICDWILDECTGVDTSTPYVVANVQTANNQSATASTLAENLTMSAKSDTNNRIYSVFAGNVDNSTTSRLELDADTNGDSDWTTVGNFGSGATRARRTTSGWNNDIQSDLTPGIMLGSNATYGQIGIELVAAATTVSGSWVSTTNAVMAATGTSHPAGAWTSTTTASMSTTGSVVVPFDGEVESILEAINLHPNPVHGIASGDDDWRFAVEILVSTGNARVGAAIVGTATVGGYEWLDLTDRVVEMVGFEVGNASFSQGLPRANVGTAYLTLENSDFYYSSWNRQVDLYREWTNNALIRFVYFKPTATTDYIITDGTPDGTYDEAEFLPAGVTLITRTDWQPLYTGIVESWDEQTEINSSLINLTLAQPISILAGINKNAVSPVGAGDTTVARLIRLLDDATYPYGITVTDTVLAAAHSSYPTVDAQAMTMQATELSANRIAEVYLTADSALAVPVRSNRDGSVLWGMPNGSQSYVFSTIDRTGVVFGTADYAYFTPPFIITNNADFVINDVSVSRAGSTAQTGLHEGSQAKWGIRSYNRNDLICTNDAMVTELVTWLLDNYSGQPASASTQFEYTDQTLQPGQLIVTNQFAAQRDLDIFDFVDVWWTTSLNTDDDTVPVAFTGRIIAATHQIQRVDRGIEWTTNYTVLALYNQELSL